MSPLQPAYLDVPLVGSKQSNDPRTAPLDGAYLLENYQIERTGAARKRHGIDSQITLDVSASRLYSQGSDTLRLELTDGTYRLRSSQSTTASAIGLGAPNGRPLMPSPPIETLVQQSVPTALATDCNTHVARTIRYFAVVSQEFTTTPTLKIAVYDGETGAPLLPAAPIPTFVSVAASPLRVSVVAGGNDDVAVVYSDSTATVLMGLRIGVGGGDLAVSALYTTTIASAVLQDTCRGPGGTVVVMTLSGTNAALSLRRVSDGVQVGSHTLATAAGTATRAAINVSSSLTRAAAMVSGTVSSSTTAHYLLSLTSTSIATVATGASPLPNPSGLVHQSTIVTDEGASGANPCYLCLQVDGLATYGSVSTGPVLTATQISALGSTLASGSYGGVQLAAKGWSPTAGQSAQPLLVLDYRGIGSSGSSAVGAAVQTYGAGYAVVDLLQEGSGGINTTRPLFSVRSWHTPGRGVRYLALPRLANYGFQVGTVEGVSTCLTAYDRASTAGVESVRAVVVRTPPPPGSQTNATRLTPTSAQASPATTLLGGGVLTALHGSDTRPAADLHPADVISLSQIGGSGTWGGASVSVRGRYVWLDASGYELTSAWSLPATIAVSGSIGAVDIELRLPQYLPSSCATRPHLQIAVAIGTSKAFAKALIEPAPGAPLTASVPAATDGLVQTVRLVPGGLTTAGIDTSELSNVCPPPPKYVSVGRQRALLVSAEDDRVYFSKPLAKGVLPEWCLELALEPPPSIGEPIACEELGDKIVVFGSAGASYFLGDGQDANGDGSPYAGPYEVLSGLGCDSIESVLKTPIGLFYRSEHTIVMIDEGLKATPLGREVFDLLSAAPRTLRSAYYERQNLAVWLLSDDVGTRTILTLNLSTMAWASWVTDQEEFTLDDLVVGDRLYAVGTGVLAQYEDRSLPHRGYDNVTVFVQGRLVTPYIRLASVQSFQRLWHVQCLVETKVANATLTLKIYRDGSPTGTTIATKTIASPGVQPVDFHVPANLQRCSSVRLEFTDGQPFPVSSTRTCGVDILGITLEIGVKRGLRAVPSAQRA